MATTINVFNFKGGCGKTTTTTQFAYILNEFKHKKTLLIDFDPQSNSTEIMDETYKNFDPNSAVPVLKGLEDFDLSNSVVHVSGDLDMIPATWQLSLLPKFLKQYGDTQSHFVLSEALKNIKDNYDYILIDTPPTLSEYTNNAILASNYVVVVMQTQEQCYSSSIKAVSYLQQLKSDFNKVDKQNYGHIVNFLGVIPYLVKRHGKVDKDTLNKAENMFGPAMFTKKIAQRERVKLFGERGIRYNDHWDRDAVNMYADVLNEAIKRIEE